MAAAAYRAADRLENARDGMTHDFTRRSGVEHAEIVLPGDASALDAGFDNDAELDWARSRSSLWDAAEAAEKRNDARVAREIEIALPHELSAEQRLELTRAFAQRLADQYGVAVDFAVHTPHGATDVRNHHAHLLMTTRKVGPDGLGEKSDLELENRKLQALGLRTSHEQVRDLRIAWEGLANEHLARAGLDVRIDHRSHQELGLKIEPTQHMGVHATQMERRGMAVSRARLDEAAAARNAALVLEKPDQVLTLITNEKSVFNRQDIARTLHRYVDGAEAFQSALAKVMASPALVVLQAEQRDEQGRVVEPARYSTREMIGIEREMAASADRMALSRGFAVAGRHVDAAIKARPFLAEEQRVAVAHVTGPEQIAVVVGLAGAGKSTMLAASRAAWEAQGYQVHGAALAGKAAEGLEEAAGIGSRTLASWTRGWERGFDRLGPRSVLVIDEAGMVGSKQLSRFITEVERMDAKLVLVGDPEQLQPIGAGAAFRAVAERVGFVGLEGVRRQCEAWQRAASVDFGRHRTAEGLAAYAAHGAIRFVETGGAARRAIVWEVTDDMAARPEGSRLVLAHRRVDVRVLNEAIRASRQARGELGRGEAEGERVYQTTEGERAFAPGDRLLFRENNRGLGVKNGMLGTVEQAEAGRLVVRLDSARGVGQGRAVSIPMADYAAVDHGYATTIHKAQGATVDRAYVLASGTMDRHLTYVAMTRHRDGVTLYADREEFSGMAELSARLSRSQAKETTLDYDRSAIAAAAEGQFATRRGLEPQSEIIVPDSLRARPAPDRGVDRQVERQGGRRIEMPAEISIEAPAQPAAGQRLARKRGMFDGLKLGTGRPAAGRDDELAGMRPPERAGEPAAPARPQVAADDLGLAVERYARALTDAMRMEAEALPILEHQKIALRKTGKAIEAIRPGAVGELLAAINYEPATFQALNELQGPARGAALVAGIEHEARVRQDPALQADRLVKVWTRLAADHAQLGGPEQAEARGKVEARMKEVASEMKRDPQIESLLRNRRRELGIDPAPPIERPAKTREIDHGIRHSRGPGMSM